MNYFELFNIKLPGGAPSLNGREALLRGLLLRKLGVLALQGLVLLPGIEIEIEIEIWVWMYHGVDAGGGGGERGNGGREFSI